MRRFIGRVVLVCFVVALAGGCDRGGPSVVVYVSTDEAIARPILQAFEDRYGVRVLMVGDTEASKTTGLLTRIRAERSSPIADVLWSSEALGTVALGRDGLLAPHISSRTQAWPTQWRDPQHLWHAFSPRPRVLVFDPQKIAAEDVPIYWSDLASPRWNRNLLIADPRFGTTGGHLAAMKSWYDAKQAGAWDTWLAAMADNHIRVLPNGNAGVVDGVLRGDGVLGLTDADDVYAANRNGANLAMVVPRHGPEPGEGAMLMPNTVAILQGAPHPKSAALLADWLCSPEVARQLAASVSGNVPLPAEVAAEFPHLRIDDPLLIDLNDVSMQWMPAVDGAVQAWREDWTR